MSAAQKITAAFDGDWHGSWGAIPTPGHSNRDRGTTVRDAADGDVTFHSFNGADWRYLKEECRARGLLPPRRVATAISGETSSRLEIVPHFAGQFDERADRNKRLALAIMEESIDPRGTLAETYLRNRGLRISDDVAGTVLRFHPRCPFDGSKRPALIAIFRHIFADEPCAIQRIALTDAGEKFGKMSLGPTRGAAVMLSDATEGCVQICEGVETGLAILNSGVWPIWAMCSAGAIEAFPLFHRFPLAVYADADEPGLNAARVAARRYQAAGLYAEVRYPPEAGLDFADLALRQAA